MGCLESNDVLVSFESGELALKECQCIHTCDFMIM